MNDRLTWYRGASPAPELLAKAELALEVELPAQLREILRNHDGGAPSWTSIMVDGVEETFGELLNFSGSRGLSPFDVISYIEDWPKGLVPFGVDPGGNCFCLDYRDSEQCPRVIFLDHELDWIDVERASHFVSSSFEEFLAMLSPTPAE